MTCGSPLANIIEKAAIQLCLMSSIPLPFGVVGTASSGPTTVIKADTNLPIHCTTSTLFGGVFNNCRIQNSNDGLTYSRNPPPVDAISDSDKMDQA